MIHDRFKNLALFLSGYMKNNDRIGTESETEAISQIIRHYACVNVPYHLVECSCCKNKVESEGYKMSFMIDDDVEPEVDYIVGYSCPNCKTIFLDKELTKIDIELMENQKCIEEKYNLNTSNSGD